MSIAPEFTQYLSSVLPLATCEQVLHSLATPLRAALRQNTLKQNALFDSTTSVARLLEHIATSHSAIPWWPNAYWWQSQYPENEFKIGWTVEHQAGAIYVQEASSMLPVAALAHAYSLIDDGLKKPLRVLDMCAAPGSKTTQLADWMNNQGLIIANELSSSRLKSLSASLTRCGVSNTVLSHQDARVFGEQTPELFDAILLDAPCTGEGTHRKDPSALKEWHINSIHQTAELQKTLIESAYKALALGGVLIYSTCTLNQYENHQVCQHLLDAHKGDIETSALNGLFSGAENACTEEGWLWVLPHVFDCEGFFVAAFRKKSSTSTPPIITPASVNIMSKLSLPERTTIDLIDASVKESFGQELSAYRHRLIQKGDTVLCVPEGFAQLPDTLRLNRLGVSIAEQKGKTWRLQHESIHLFNAKNTVALTRGQACDYLMGRDLSLNDLKVTPMLSAQDIVLSFEGGVLGLAGNIKSKLKNRYPREFVSDKVV